MKFISLLKAVQEKNLSKEQVEDYFTDMSNLYATIKLQKSDMQKKQAIFIDTCTEKSVVAKERKFDASEDGQRLIELRNYEDIADKMLASLKNRIYRLL